jgi:dephospho-CoA kinase
MANNPRVIAITGGIGSGKSAVAKLFSEFGAAVVDADTLAREVVQPGSAGLEAVKGLFPEQSVTQVDGALDRAKVGSIIFGDPEKRKALESILHPLIRASWLARLRQLKTTDTALIAYVVPLLFESATPMPELQMIVLVTAPEDIRVARIIARDTISAQAAMQRISSQLPDSQKIPRSDFVIKNDSSLESLREQTAKVFAAIAATTTQR